MTRAYFFGFGSLVNAATHDYGQIRPAKLTGWRRLWVETDAREFAFLSAEPCNKTEISGLMAAVPNEDWAALDAREFAYERVDVSSAVTYDADQNATQALETPQQVAAYSVPKATHVNRPTPAPILLSYLDVVVQGYAQVFGPDGVRAFFDTTVGWERGVLDDRSTLIYPRHQTLSGEEREMVDSWLLQKEGLKVGNT